MQRISFVACLCGCLIFPHPPHKKSSSSMICLTDAKEDKQKEGGRGKRERDFVMNIPCETFCGVDEAQSLSSFFSSRQLSVELRVHCQHFLGAEEK